MLNRRRFPLANRPAKSSFPPLISDRYGTKLDDERRLFYVAVTRARERLFMLDTAAADQRVRSGLPDRPTAEGSTTSRGVIRIVGFNLVDCGERFAQRQPAANQGEPFLTSCCTSNAHINLAFAESPASNRQWVMSWVSEKDSMSCYSGGRKAITHGTKRR